MNSSPQWTPAAIRSLGPTTDLLTLGSILGVSRWKAYQMRRDGRWEQLGIKIIVVGSHYRVTVQSILAVLGCDPENGTAPGSPQPASRPAVTAAVR
jgi:hypothetical protein